MRIDTLDLSIPNSACCPPYTHIRNLPAVLIANRPSFKQYNRNNYNDNNSNNNNDNEEEG